MTQIPEATDNKINATAGGNRPCRALLRDDRRILLQELAARMSATGTIRRYRSERGLGETAAASAAVRGRADGTAIANAGWRTADSTSAFGRCWRPLVQVEGSRIMVRTGISCFGRNGRRGSWISVGHPGFPYKLSPAGLMVSGGLRTVICGRRNTLQVVVTSCACSIRSPSLLYSGEWGKLGCPNVTPT